MSDYESNYLEQYADDFGVQCYSDEKIMEIILEFANDKIENLYTDLEEINNINVYKFNVTDQDIPQTALKIYRIGRGGDDIPNELVGVLDVIVNKYTDDLIFAFYDLKSSPKYAIATYINGKWDSIDGIPTPMQENDFSTKEIDNLIEEIYNNY